MDTKEKEGHISWLENLLKDFRQAKKRGKETNDNQVRAQSISDIEEITRRLESYIRNNEELLEVITGTEIDLARNIDWNDVVRPDHFEEDLQEAIKTLRKQ